MRELARHGGQARSGLAIILVTHHVSEIIPEIERVILMKEGQIVADGAKEAVLTEANLHRIFGIEVQLQKSDGYFHAY